MGAWWNIRRTEAFMIRTITKQLSGNNNLPYLLVGRKPNKNRDWKTLNIEALK